MINSDLKYIKKHYGEKFAHLCRDLFPTILETEGLLKDIITKHFAPSRNLYYDITKHGLVDDFKDFVYCFINLENDTMQSVGLSPEELLLQAGYILYPECQTEADIQKFIKYYASGEELCTFGGRRLTTCRVWFAVKENVDEIKRENFPHPTRQDEYGTSVISIQFTRGDSNYLSIKNRYNHSVDNPDATFGNNLDNIIPGLSQAFTQAYGLKIDQSIRFKIPSYIRTSAGKFIKYNIEYANTYCCANNTIVCNGEEKQLPPEKYLLFDNYVLNLETKQVFPISALDLKTFKLKPDYLPTDSFVESLGEIKAIKRVLNKDGMKIILTPDEGEPVEIDLNNRNQIVGYSNSNVEYIGDDFLNLNTTLTTLNIPNAINLGSGFLSRNKSLTSLNLKNVRTIGDDFLYCNNLLTSLNLPNVITIGNNFMHYNNSLTVLNMPKVETIASDFLVANNSLTELSLPNLLTIDRRFLLENCSLTKLNLPNVQAVGDSFLLSNNSLTTLDLPNLYTIGADFLPHNKSLTTLNVQNARKIGRRFLYNNNSLTKLYLPNVDTVGPDFLHSNNSITELYAPYLMLYNLVTNDHVLKVLEKSRENSLER